MMRIGGCAAETACDLCVYLDKYKNTRLCPFDVNELSREKYVSLSETMKPYLHPRMKGIDRLDIYLDGFGQYLKDKNSALILSKIEGSESSKTAGQALIQQLDSGYPAAFLCLYHSNPRYKDYEWHWFIINGYEIFEDTLMVKAVTYSEWEWLNFEELWNSKRARRGGMVFINE